MVTRTQAVFLAGNDRVWVSDVSAKRTDSGVPEENETEIRVQLS